MKKPLLQTENRVFRTYRGGRQLDAFIGKPFPEISFKPEDWISSFVEAKNKERIEGEGISRVLLDGREMPITEAVSADDLGPGRRESGVLIKYLDSAERLGIQVHPTPEFSRKYFGSDYGKTECWHILGTDGDAAVYIGFKEGVTRREWKELFERQDTERMLSRMHRFSVKKGDTVLVTAGTPHAIDAGCFLLEIQEPTDYTMRVEKTTLAGERLTPMQIHYGVGEEAMLDCFIYEGLSEAEARKRYLIEPRHTESGTDLVSYADTPCFALKRLSGGEETTPESFVTLIVTESGTVRIGDTEMTVKRGERWFIPYGCGTVKVNCGECIVCYPPRL